MTGTMHTCSSPCLYESGAITTTLLPGQWLVMIIELKSSEIVWTRTSTTQLGINITSLAGGEGVQTVIVETKEPSIYDYDNAPKAECYCHLSSSLYCNPSMNSTYYECEPQVACNPSAKTYYLAIYNNEEKAAKITANAYLLDNGESCSQTNPWWIPIILVFGTLIALGAGIGIMLFVFYQRSRPNYSLLA